MSEMRPERTELQRSWVALLQEIAGLSDALGLDSCDWSEADECTLQQEFDPWVVIREAKKRASACEADRKRLEEARGLIAEALGYAYPTPELQTRMREFLAALAGKEKP